VVVVRSSELRGAMRSAGSRGRDMAHDAAKQTLAIGSAGPDMADRPIDATRAVVVDTFGLSPLQQGMLFHHVEDPRSGVDIEQLVVHLAEAVDPDALRRAWDLLVQRHPILRVPRLGTAETSSRTRSRG